MSSPIRISILALALAAASAWAWICFCWFPGEVFNDVRLAPVFMAVHGVPVYTLPGEGIITTWMYGPVPLWVWSPAALAGSAVSALLTAGALNLALTLAAIAATCRWWPGAPGPAGARLLAFAACLAAWPDQALRYLQADNVAIAFGLLGNLLLARDPAGARPAMAWLAAAATAGALGSKQTTLGLLVAQVAWLAWGHGRAAAWRHAARTLAVGAVLLAIAAAQFGPRELWFGIVEIGRHLPPASDIANRLRQLAPALAIQVGIPAALLWPVLVRAWPGPDLRLPALAWACSLPLGIAGLLTIGGNINNLHGYPLLLPALFTSLACRFASARAQALAAAMVAGLVLGRVASADEAHFQPKIAVVREAVALQARHRDELWMPWNPLVTYFGDGRFYHAEDGLFVRFVTSHPVTIAHARGGIPPRVRAIAFQGPDTMWELAGKLAPAGAIRTTDGTWTVIGWP